MVTPRPSATTRELRIWAAARLNAANRSRVWGSIVEVNRSRTSSESTQNWTNKLDHKKLSVWALWDSNPGPTDYESVPGGRVLQ